MKWIPLYLRRKASHDKTGIILAILSVSAGVLLFVSTIICYNSASSYFSNYMQRKYSGAEVVVKNSQNQKFDVKDEIPGVRKVLPMNRLESYFYNSINDTYHAYEVIELDLTAELDNGSIHIQKGEIPKAGECLIPFSVAKALKIDCGDKISLRDSLGKSDYTVSGILEEYGIVSEDEIFAGIIDPDYAQEYKLLLNQDTKAESVILHLRQTLNKDFEVVSTNNLSDSFLNGVMSFFDILLAFAIVVLLLGLYVTYITIHGYVKAMKKDISILKVLGAKSSELLCSVLCLGVIIAGTGIVIGVAAGIGISKSMLNLISKGFGSDTIFKYSIPVTGILFGCVAVLLACIVTAFILSRKYVNKRVIANIKHEENATSPKKLKVVSIILLLLTSIIRTFFIYNTVLRIFLNILLCVLILFVLIIFFYKQVSLFCIDKFPFISGKNQVLIKQNLKNGFIQNVKIVCLITIITALTGSMYSVFHQVKVTMDNMVENSYFGDIVITSVIGRAIDETSMNDILKLSFIDRAYPVLQKYVDMKETEVQVTGYTLDETNIKYLEKKDNFGTYKVNKLQQQDTIMVSKRVLKQTGLKVGDSVKLNSKDVKIIGAFSSVQNNGRSAILSQETFHSLFKEYEIRYINAYVKGDYDIQKLNKEIKNKTSNDFLYTKDVSDMIREESSQTAQFIYLIYGMLIVLCVVNGLIIVNIIINENKSNQYGMSIIKGLGETSGESVKRSSIYGISYWTFATLLGVAGSIFISYNLCRIMNELMEWDISFKMGHIEIISIFYLVLIVGTGVIVTRKAYRKSTVSLFEENIF